MEVAFPDDGSADGPPSPEAAQAAWLAAAQDVSAEPSTVVEPSREQMPAAAPSEVMEGFVPDAADGASEVTAQEGAPPEAAAEVAPRPVRAGRGRLVGRILGVLVLLAALAGGAAVALRPMPWRRVVKCDIVAKQVGTPTAPRDGVVLRLEAADGARVEAGQALLVLDEAPLLVQRAELQGRLKDAVARGKRLKPSTSKAKVAKATRALKTADAAVAGLEKRRAKIESGKLPETKKAAFFRLLDKQLAPKRKAQDKAKAALEKLTHANALAALATERDDLRAQLKTLDEARAQSTVTAPVAGLFQAQGLAVGAQLQSGAAAGRLIDGYTLSARPSPPLEAPPKSLTLVMEGKRIPVDLVEVAGTFEGALPAPAATPPAEAVLDIDLGTRRAYQAWLGSE